MSDYGRLTELDSATPAVGVMKMLMRTDPFRELDRLTQQVFGTTTRPAVRVKAEYDAGVLRLTIPVAEQAKPHKIKIASNDHRHAIKS